MPQINGSFKEEIYKRVQSKQLTEWDVALAPSISYGFWQKCCIAFSDQLIEQGFILQAATYRMALHQLNEVIALLMDKMYFKEALLLARVYLPESNPIIEEIIKKWITNLEQNGNLLAASYL